MVLYFIDNTPSIVAVISPIIMTNETTMSLPNCPKCDADYTYEDGALLVCPMCAHEWTAAEADAAQNQADEDEKAVMDCWDRKPLRLVIFLHCNETCFCIGLARLSVHQQYPPPCACT